MEEIGLQELQTLIYVMVGLVLLFVIGLVVYLVVANRKARAQRSGSRLGGDSALWPSSQTAGRILALVREEPGAPLQVEVGSVRYSSLAEVQDPEIKRQVVAAAMELIQFTGVLGREALAPAPLERTETWREDLRKGSQAELEHARSATARDQRQPRASPEVEEQFLSSLADLQDAGSVEAPSVISSVRHVLVPKPLEGSPAPTFVDEIEAIVQRRLQLIPALAGRGLHVSPGPGGKVLFAFEGHTYDSVEEIPNLTARQLVQDSIREWDETA